MQMQVIVFASFVPAPGQEAAVEALLRGMVAPTRAEPGNIRYDLLRDADGAGFHFMEIYRDQAALEAHRASDHYRAYRARITDHLAEPIAVRLLAALDLG